MSDKTTTVLYILTTLAQSCAALAAFVGAVGVFRLQALREDRNAVERDLRGLAGRSLFGMDEAFLWPVEHISERVDKAATADRGTYR